MSKKENYFVKGKFDYVDPDDVGKKSKKELRKEQEKMLKQKDKEIAKQCECNHLDRKHNKSHFKRSDDGNYLICKICGGKIICNPDLLTTDAAESAVEVIYSVFSRVRNRMRITEQMDDDITSALKIVSRTPALLEMLKNDTGNGGKKKDKKKDKKKKKNKDKGSYSRMAY